jgi:hypothetical protein
MQAFRCYEGRVYARHRESRQFGRYVMLADPLWSYVSGATVAVTGGKPIL